MARGIRVLVAGEQVLMCEGMRSLLKGYDDIEVVGEASDGRQAVETTRSLQPDVVIIDTGMKVLDGFEVTRRLLRDAPKTKVVILTGRGSRDDVVRAFVTGAYGCMPKTATSADFASAVRAVHRGEMYLHACLTKTMVEGFLSLRKVGAPEDPYEHLTAREMHVLRLIVEGRTSRQVAEELGLAVKTVVNHRTNVMSKLGIRSRVDLVKYAIRRQIVSLGREK